MIYDERSTDRKDNSSSASQNGESRNTCRLALA